MIVLDAHTDYSFMRGFGTPSQWLARAKDVGVTALGIADYCSTWGHIPFRDAFKDSGIKLLYGVQVPVVSFLDKDPRHSLVTLIAKKSTDQLYKAVTTAHAQTYYRPRLTWKQVAELDDCFVIVNDLLRAHAKAVPADALVGHRLLLPDHMPDRAQVLAYGPVYPTANDRIGFELFQAISENHRIGELINDGFHLLRESEARTIFKKFQWEPGEYCAEQIAAACTAEPPRGSLLDMGVPEHMKGAKLRSMAYDGAKALGLLTHAHEHLDGTHYGLEPEYEARLNTELAIIADKKFEDYFFFVTDVISWAKERMFVGPGRGSAGGSLLCYLLGITTVDPLKFGTLFERFIDVTRSDLPDIDIDFPDVRREEVFDYLKQKYGNDHFARLGTLTEQGGKSALNNVARATGVPFEAAREIGKWTEGSVQGSGFPPKWIFEHVEEVQPILKKYPSLRMAALLDERDHWNDEDKQHISHHGVHASGVVVTNEPAYKFGAVDREGTLSMDMRTAEKIGLVKLDVLGLTTLSVIQETCDLIGINPTSLYSLDWNDHAVFDGVFNSDRVTGVFQFEGHAVRTLMKQVKIDKFDDICALASLARPGPLIGGAAAGWVKARNGAAVEGDALHPSLDETFGVICYQEQFMYIARDIAGFNVEQVNGMRRAVAKKDVNKLHAYREAFVKGVTEYKLHRHPLEVATRNDQDGNSYVEWVGPSLSEVEAKCKAEAEELWETICDFGSYAFNKAHAVAYGMISFMSAWLKHYHPIPFTVAQLRNAADDEQAKNLLRELVEAGVNYIPFDKDKSQATWTVIDGTLYGGFDSIKGIGTKTAERYVVMRDTFEPETIGKGKKKRLIQCWLDKLTDAQREKIEKGETRYVSMTYFTEKYRNLYADPDGWRSPGIPKGIKPPVHRIKDIPDEKGSYAFLGRILKLNIVDDDAPDRVAKRDGKKRGRDHFFVNLTIEDDTGEISGTINRFKFDQFKWLSEESHNGKDFLFRANIIENGRRWVFFDNVIELKGQSNEIQTDGRPGDGEAASDAG